MSGQLKPGKILLFGFLGLVATLIFSGIGLLVLFIVGQESGREFSPDTFATRSYYRCKLPLIGWEPFPLTHREDTSFVADYLLTKNLLPPTAGPQTWVTVTNNKGIKYLEAELLINLLEENNGSYNNYFWHDWSVEHPEMAQILWPQIASLARDSMFWAVVELTEIARYADSNGDDLQKFQEQTDTFMGEVYFEAAEQELVESNPELALERITKSIDYHPTSASLLKRAALNDRLGNREAAQQDTLRARKLK